MKTKKRCKIDGSHRDHQDLQGLAAEWDQDVIKRAFGRPCFFGRPCAQGVNAPEPSQRSCQHQEDAGPTFKNLKNCALERQEGQESAPNESGHRQAHSADQLSLNLDFAPKQLAQQSAEEGFDEELTCQPKEDDQSEANPLPCGNI